MNNCYFCEVIKTNSYEIFFEHEHYTVLWDGTPSVPGHAMITPKRHVQYIEQLTDLEASELIPLARQIGGVVHNTDLEKIYTRMISLEPNQNRCDYYQNCLDKVRIYQRPPEAFTMV